MGGTFSSTSATALFDDTMAETANSNQTEVQKKRERDSGDSSSSVSKKPKTEREEVSDVVCSNSTMKSDWASLPLDVVILILDKLLELINHVRFAAVCKDWRSFAKDYNHVQKRWRHLLPILLMSTSQEKQNVLHRVTFAGVKIEAYKSLHDLLHLDNGKKLVGSSHGWLATVELVDQLVTITILDPFRKAVAPIRLPPLDFNSKLRQKNPEKFSYSVNHIRKVMLSTDPILNPSNYFVIAFYEENKCCNVRTKLAFIKGGQNYWTYVYKNQRFSDAIFYKNQVYAVGDKGRIVSFDVNRCYNLAQPRKAKPLKPKALNLLNVFQKRACMEYLVESTRGDLWHVKRFVKSREPRRKFEVYKVVFNDIDETIVDRFAVSGIGDEALFVGGIGQPASVVAANFPRCESNSIYYTNDMFNCAHPNSIPYEFYRIGGQLVRPSTPSRLDLSCMPLWIVPPVFSV